MLQEHRQSCNKKKELIASSVMNKKMAESKRFELLVTFATQPFQDCTLSRSDNSPLLDNNKQSERICQ